MDKQYEKHLSHYYGEMNALLNVSALEEAFLVATKALSEKSAPPEHPAMQIARVVMHLHKCLAEGALTADNILALSETITLSEERKQLLFRTLQLAQFQLSLYPVPAKFIQAYFAAWDQPNPHLDPEDLKKRLNLIAESLLGHESITCSSHEGWKGIEEYARVTLLSLFYQDVWLFIWVICHLMERQIQLPLDKRDPLILSWFVVVCNIGCGNKVKKELITHHKATLSASNGRDAAQILVVFAYTQCHFIAPLSEAGKYLSQSMQIAQGGDRIWVAAAPLYQFALYLHTSFNLELFQTPVGTALEQGRSIKMPGMVFRVLMYLQIIRCLRYGDSPTLETPQYSLTQHLNSLQGEINSTSRIHIFPSVGLLWLLYERYNAIRELLIPLVQAPRRITFCFLHADWAFLLSVANQKLGLKPVAGLQEELAELASFDPSTHEWKIFYLRGDYLKALLIASDNQCHWGTFICAREVIRNGISEGNLELAQKAFSKLQAALVVATR